MAERPTGTVTFLFSDIQGSTGLLRDLGAECYGDALEDQRRLLREAFARHDGYEVDTQGDAFFVAFNRAREAIRAAGELQRSLAGHAWPEGRDLRVRVGIHTCEATATREGYVGVGVHRGARICSAGHGGQVLVSQTTRDLLVDEDVDIGLRDLGEHRLKDLTEPQRLFQLVDPALPGDFPPLRTLDNRPTNLPVQATPLVGRGREVAEVGELLRREEVRLVTLTGPGGTGKTRLALQTGAELVDEFPNGVFFVALAAITDPDVVVPTIAQTLGVSEAGGQSLPAYLATKKLLLVVDNVEQVVSAAPKVAEVLAEAPQVKVLATSREALRVEAEHVYPVPPLELPDPRSLPELSLLSQYEAVALFAERAEAVQPSFEVTTENAPAVAEICVRLDGLPLALELAAARIPLLAPEAMLKRLGERLKLLTSGARDLPARQQTLRATLAWSHDLLGDGERDLFARLGVFAGGFTLEAAEKVCTAELDTVASLVAQSLVQRDDERFTMLETVREYALERLDSDEDEVRDRHAEHFETLAEEAYLERFTREGERSEELEREHDNLRAALDWLTEADPGRRLRLAGALGWFWHVHSHFAEGRSRLAEALDGTSERDEVRARALTAAGELAAWTGDLSAARPLIEEAVSIWRELGREREAALALHELGWGYFYASDDPAARAYMEESLKLQRPVGDPSLVNRAQIGLLQVLVSIGELETVERLAQESLELSQRLGDLRSEHFAVHFLADVPLIRGDCQQAEERYRRSLELAVELGDRSETAVEIQGLGMAAAGLSKPQRALRLAGAAEAELEALGIDLSGVQFWTALHNRYFGQAREQLGPDGAEAAWEEGRRLGLERAVDEALSA